ncbi:hypothetical protein [Micromonospora rubida]|uniref:hypothetical protein n=1 Tax=Micromonospora rubida TaxID=2697657 RepID=UPI001376E64F|nr:hypothetical protein [Micromonospora rubida]NBE80344.1 hypothetical protein [Micromonospora rubida]
MAALALLLGLLVGAAAGYGYERHHVRGLVDQMLAADTATTGQHRLAVLAAYAARLHIRPRGVR